MLKTIQVLYEDADLVVFNKPAGMLVVPSPKKEKNTLTDIVNEHYVFGATGSKGQAKRLYPCHRLDRETSGVILFAVGAQNQERMMAEFKAQRVQKKYIAFVHGQMTRPSGEITKPVHDFHERQFARQAGHRRPAGPAHSAKTSYKVVEVRRGFSVVEVSPKTGRTHQIRIHFQQIGYPLLGERLYAHAKDFSLNFRRLALHAWQVSWVHPVSKKRITVESPLPDDMRKFWESGFILKKR